jgi:dihydroorotase
MRKLSHRLSILLAIVLPLWLGAACAPQVRSYDLVILNGHIMDPESGMDAVYHLGINSGEIRALGTESLRGQKVIDAAGLVVAPGFIDLHQHGQDAENYRYKAADGVTTALELEAGTVDVDRWYAEREGKALINYGISIGHMPVRMQVMKDPGTTTPTGDAARRPARDDEIVAMKQYVERGLTRGALGTGFVIELTPAASNWEILELFRETARAGAPAFVHVRYGEIQEPRTGVAGLEEALAASVLTGIPIHIVHLASDGVRFTPQMLQMIGEARARGLDVTTEMYPYTSGMAEIESSFYDEGWKERKGVDYKDLQWAATGERLTAESFAHYRKQGGLVIKHYIPEEVVRVAVSDPLTMIASDGEIYSGIGHPRTAGTYARVLGSYVREEKLLSLMDALRKMTLMPAQRLEKRAPMMKKKGRIRVGADADLTLFDREGIRDRATYTQPTLPSDGIRYVIVNGTIVVGDGKLEDGVAPGLAIRAPIDRAGGSN